MPALSFPSLSYGRYLVGEYLSTVVEVVAANYLCSADRDGISVECLRKLLDVCWQTALLLLDKSRCAMAARDKMYVLGTRHQDQVELDDASVGGRGRTSS